MEQLLNLLSLVYLGFALMLVYRLYKAGADTFDDHFTSHDRGLISGVAFYLVAPLVVACHEAAHAATVLLFGGRVASFHYFFYWGYVEPAAHPALGHAQLTAVALAGNLVSVAMGAACFLYAWRGMHNAARHWLGLEAARILMALGLVVYPLFSLVANAGDFAIMRRELNAMGHNWGEFAIAFYSSVGLVWLWFWQRPATLARRRELTSPLFDPRRVLRQRVIDDPSDANAHKELGRIEAAMGSFTNAARVLEQATQLLPDDAVVHYLLGVSRLGAGEAQPATDALRQAGTLIDKQTITPTRDMLRVETLLALASARLALKDGEGAAHTAEEALRMAPDEARALLLYTDALLASGKKDDAQARLEAALADAKGTLAFEIRKRLESLR